MPYVPTSSSPDDSDDRAPVCRLCGRRRGDTATTLTLDSGTVTISGADLTPIEPARTDLGRKEQLDQLRDELATNPFGLTPSRSSSNTRVCSMASSNRGATAVRV
jgi:hypothetical protein